MSSTHRCCFQDIHRSLISPLSLDADAGFRTPQPLFSVFVVMQFSGEAAPNPAIVLTGTGPSIGVVGDTALAGLGSSSSSSGAITSVVAESTDVSATVESPGTHEPHWDSWVADVGWPYPEPKRRCRHNCADWASRQCPDQACGQHCLQGPECPRHGSVEQRELMALPRSQRANRRRGGRGSQDSPEHRVVR